MSSINLAPGTQYVMVARKRRFRLYAIAIGIISIFGIGGLGLYIYTRTLQSSSDAIKNQILVVDQKIQSLRPEALRVALFEKRLVDISKLLDSHIGWENILADLERLLPADTVVTQLNATREASSLTINGTTQNIDQIALALASLTKDVNHPSVFSSGTVKTVQRQDQENAEGAPTSLYAFTMTLDFNQASLNKSAL